MSRQTRDDLTAPRTAEPTAAEQAIEAAASDGFTIHGPGQCCPGYCVDDDLHDLRLDQAERYVEVLTERLSEADQEGWTRGANLTSTPPAPKGPCAFCRGTHPSDLDHCICGSWPVILAAKADAWNHALTMPLRLAKHSYARGLCSTATLIADLEEQRARNPYQEAAQAFSGDRREASVHG